MKIDCILSSCNLNPLYIDFIPLFIQAWKKIIKNVDIKIILISDHIPNNLLIYSDNIILYNHHKDISTAFISQYIRLLYPGLLNYENGVLISDIDMLPMNKKYYVNSIANIDNDRFICYRNILFNKQQIAMCYNVANSNTWRQIFGIDNIEQLSIRLDDVYKMINYNNTTNCEGWYKDQLDLFMYVTKWRGNTGKVTILTDKFTGYNRLNRMSFISLNKHIVHNVQRGLYSDYHVFRPYLKYKHINDIISQNIPTYD